MPRTNTACSNPRLSVNQQIDKGISKLIKGLPPVIHSDIAYLLKGKRMRSKLMMELMLLLKGNMSAMVLPAVGVEMVHTISLIHDDVIDRQKERRGKPTLHHIYGNHLAVLVGDFLLQGLVQQTERYRYHTKVIKVLYEKIAELCKGELLQDIPNIPNITSRAGDKKSLKSSSSTKRSREREQYLVMVKQKTGSLFSYSFVVPLLITLLNHSKKTAKLPLLTQREKINEKALITFAEECGYVYGIAFQLADDLADLEEDLALLVNTSKTSATSALPERLPSYAMMAWAEHDPKGFKQYLKNQTQKKHNDSGLLKQVQKQIQAVIWDEIKANLNELKHKVEEIKLSPAGEYYTFLREKVERLFSGV